MSDLEHEVLKQIQSIRNMGQTPAKVYLGPVHAKSLLSYSTPFHAGFAVGMLFGLEIIVSAAIPSPRVVSLESEDNLAYIVWWEKFKKHLDELE